LLLVGYLKVLEKKQSLISNSCLEHNNPTTVNTTTTNPNLIMGDLLRPLNFAAIQGAPHAIPDKAIEKLPAFQGNNVVSANAHILSVDLCIGKVVQWSQ
jgi:hypothetical protein